MEILAREGETHWLPPRTARKSIGRSWARQREEEKENHASALWFGWRTVTQFFRWVKSKDCELEDL